MTPTRERIENLVMRMQGDFLEISGLSLTVTNAGRRFGIDEATCKAVLRALVDANVLTTNREGAYVRLFPLSDGTSRFSKHAA